MILFFKIATTYLELLDLHFVIFLDEIMINILTCINVCDRSLVSDRTALTYRTLSQNPSNP